MPRICVGRLPARHLPARPGAEQERVREIVRQMRGGEERVRLLEEEGVGDPGFGDQGRHGVRVERVRVDRQGSLGRRQEYRQIVQGKRDRA